MKKIMLAAMRSGSGKTVLSCGLMSALRQEGMQVHAFKCGPDYIDPMFHSRILGVPSRNLDLFLQGEEKVKQSLGQCQADLALIEAAMGYYDGVAETAEASAWNLASVTNTPVILSLRPNGESMTLAAETLGMLQFRNNHQIRGLILTDCGEEYALRLQKMLERETGLPVLGFLPKMEEARLPSRHLGLMKPEEIEDFHQRFTAIGEQVRKSINLELLLSLAEPEENTGYMEKQQKPRCRIAVARDEAFCFFYEDSLSALREAGAELVFFSPLKDGRLPDDTDGLYLCGGYPELYAAQLADNRSLRAEIRERIRNGLPTIAECGGFLYLLEKLQDPDGNAWEMCDVLPGTGFPTGSLKRFGYVWLETEDNSMLFQKGERIPAHEFHHWDCTEPGNDLYVRKPDGREWHSGFANGKLYAAFPHLHLGGRFPLASRFVDACTGVNNQ